MAITATVILLLTIGMSFLFIRKYRKTSEQNQQELKKSKEENELLNNQLQQSETSLKHLSKGVVNFLSISIDSIFELGSMRHTVLNKLRSKEIEQLTALFKGETNLAQNQKRLLRRFDIAFSRLYPDFQKQVNDLLKDDCKIESPENFLAIARPSPPPVVVSILMFGLIQLILPLSVIIDSPAANSHTTTGKFPPKISYFFIVKFSFLFRFSFFVFILQQCLFH